MQRKAAVEETPSLHVHRRRWEILHEWPDSGGIARTYVKANSIIANMVPSRTSSMTANIRRIVSENIQTSFEVFPGLGLDTTVEEDAARPTPGRP